MRLPVAAVLLTASLVLAPAARAEQIVWVHNYNGSGCHPECGFDLWTMNPDGSGARVSASSPRGNAQGVAWSPDGRHLAYAASREGPTGNGSFGGVSDLHVATTDLTEDRVVAEGLVGLRSDPSWSPDGRELVFRLMSYPNGRERLFPEGDLWTVRADGSGLRQLTSLAGNEGEPAFAPGGNRISFLHGPRPRTDGATEPAAVFSVAADGSDLTRMTLGNVSAIYNGLSYSPDGRELAFVGGDGATLVMSVAGGEVRRVPFVPSLDPQWSPRGDALVFWGNRFFDLFRVDLRPFPGTPVRLTWRDPRATSYGSSHAWIGDLVSPPPVERKPPAVVLARERSSPRGGATLSFGPGTGARGARVLTIDRPRQLRFLAVDRSGLRRVSVAVQRKARSRSSAPPRFRRLTGIRAWRRLVGSWKPGTYEVRFKTVDVRGNSSSGSRRLLVRLRERG